MTGHNFLGYHNALVNEAENEKICLKCDYGQIQDTEHIIASCLYFLGLREKIFKEFLLEPPFNGLSIGKVLQFLQSSGLEGLAWKSEGDSKLGNES